MSTQVNEQDENDDNFVDQSEGKMTKDKLKGLVKENFMPGLTVALVSVPLSCALAIAQGATPMMGLDTAIYGPAVGGLLGGSHYNVLGPAGALVNIVGTLALVNGQAIIPLVALFGGMLSFLVYLLKLEKYCTMIPLSVLEGFSLGVATTIGLGQFGNAFGLYNLPKHKHFYKNVAENFSDVGQMQPKELLPFLVFFVFLMSLMKWVPGRPWIVLVAVLGILYGWITKTWAATVAPTILLDIYPVMGQSVQLWDFSYWSRLGDDPTNKNKALQKAIPVVNLIVGALKVSFVAVLETLISARIADNRTGTRFDQSKEIFGMSLANMVSGLLGGTPCTGVLVRTAVNIGSGATHKTSQFINAMVVLLIVGVGAPVFVYLPMPVIAAILVTSSCRLVPLTVMDKLWHLDRPEFFILIISWLICVFADGAAGLLVGGFVSLLRLAMKTSEAQLRMDVPKDSVLTAKLQGSLNYINCPDFETQIVDKMQEEDPTYVCLELDEVVFVDVDGLDVLQKIHSICSKKEGCTMALVVSKEEQDAETSVLTRSSFLHELKERNLVFSTIDDALAAMPATSAKSNAVDA